MFGWYLKRPRTIYRLVRGEEPITEEEKAAEVVSLTSGSENEDVESKPSGSKSSLAKVSRRQRRTVEYNLVETIIHWKVKSFEEATELPPQYLEKGVSAFHLEINFPSMAFLKEQLKPLMCMEAYTQILAGYKANSSGVAKFCNFNSTTNTFVHMCLSQGKFEYIYQYPIPILIFSFVLNSISIIRLLYRL